jgi:regulatory LuxR family protein
VGVGDQQRVARARVDLRPVPSDEITGGIAKPLFITEKTVSVHATHILARLQVTSRSEAAR